MKGTIKKLVQEKGFGFIVGEDKIDYFLHRSALKNCAFEDLHVGDEVEFEDAEGPKGPRAEDIFL